MKETLKYLKELLEYRGVVDLCWNKPPRDVFAWALMLSSKYPLDFVYLFDEYKEMIGGLVLVKVAEKVFGISTVAINPRFQRKGFGLKLLDKAHNKYKGLFLAKARFKGFYEKKGYVLIKQDEEYYYYAYLNDVSMVDF